MRGPYVAALVVVAHVVGYAHGFMVGEREGQDSDPDEGSAPPELDPFGAYAKANGG